MYFKYGGKELNYLKKKDKKLAYVIDRVGFVERKLEPDVFICIVKNIVGQQISNKALDTIWNRFIDRVGKVTPENIYNSDLDGIGISAKKVMWIKEFSRKVLEKEFSIEALYEKSDNDAIKELCTLDGIGKWTAEMVLIFSEQETESAQDADSVQKSRPARCAGCETDKRSQERLLFPDIG